MNKPEALFEYEKNSLQGRYSLRVLDARSRVGFDQAVRWTADQKSTLPTLKELCIICAHFPDVLPKGWYWVMGRHEGSTAVIFNPSGFHSGQAQTSRLANALAVTRNVGAQDADTLYCDIVQPIPAFAFDPRVVNWIKP